MEYKQQVKITWFATATGLNGMEWDGAELCILYTLILFVAVTGLIRVEPFADKRKLNAHRIPVYAIVSCTLSQIR